MTEMVGASLIGLTVIPKIFESTVLFGVGVPLSVTLITIFERPN